MHRVYFIFLTLFVSLKNKHILLLQSDFFREILSEVSQ